MIPSPMTWERVRVLHDPHTTRTFYRPAGEGTGCVGEGTT